MPLVLPKIVPTWRVMHFMPVVYLGWPTAGWPEWCSYVVLPFCQDKLDLNRY